MEKDAILEMIRTARRLTDEADVPGELRVPAFEYALRKIGGPDQGAENLSGTQMPAPARRAAASVDDEGPDVPGLLALSKTNADRFLVFLELLAYREEPATVAALVELFRTYRQDVPKLPTRDLANMVARGLVDTVRRSGSVTFSLKRRGRDRLAELPTSGNAT